MAMSRASNPKQYHRDPGADDKAKQKEAEERRKDKEFADKYLLNKKCGGKVHKKMSSGGSTMKEVPANNAGLKKLPTEVRNKMGFKKSGGAVKKMRAGGKCAVDGIAMRGKTKIKGKR